MNWLRRCCQSAILKQCPPHTLPRLYTTKLPVSARSRWSLQGVPPPKSILEDDDAHVDLSEDNDIVNGVQPDALPPHLRGPPKESTPHEHKAHRDALRKQFPNGWLPPKKLSREAMDGLRQLHRFDSEKFSTPVLAEKFKVSPEAVRRILKSKWEPSREKRMQLVEREREVRSERIRLSRLKERLEAQEVEKLRAGKNKGVVAKVGLTFT
ncbi:hypothetical protein AX15_003302 [Amanita polypyramis BW_CC]|nr:hypothetical protein AX15_003302 [Amanita polypyramis BW_CC]